MYQRQYSQVYFMRLRLLHKVLLERVRQRWPGTPVVKILEVGKNEGLDCAVIGTVYKEMKLKPSILQEYQKASALQRLMAPATSFCSADDKLVLEDEGARMKLEAAAPSTSAADGAPATGLPVQSLVTGVVVAVRGSHSPNGTFQVTDLCYAGWAPQPERPRPQPGSASKTVALLSGLAVSNSQQQRLRIDVLCDYLRGMLGRDVDAEDSSSICRLVVAGGLLKGSVDSLATATPMSREQRSSLLPVQDADMLLAELCSGLPVTLMPGPGDPANVSLPQQPLHRCLLEGAAAFRSLHRTTNPHEFALDGVRILGCSGQNLEDVLRSSHQESRLEAARSLLLDHRHLAPTAPDTLPCFPYNDQDPFVLHHLPHVFFIANQPRFETALYEGPEGQVVRVVLVPSFDTTGELVLVNLDSLEASTMQFECSF